MSNTVRIICGVHINSLVWLEKEWGPAVCVSRDFTNQNATQFGNTETEKGLRRERRHERGKNKVTDANATSLEAELYKSFKLCFIAGVSLYIIKWQHSERQGKL